MAVDSVAKKHVAICGGQPVLLFWKFALVRQQPSNILITTLCPEPEMRQSSLQHRAWQSDSQSSTQGGIETSMVEEKQHTGSQRTAEAAHR